MNTLIASSGAYTAYDAQSDRLWHFFCIRKPSCRKGYARQRRHSKRPSADILDFIEPQIAPFDPPTPKTLTYNQTWSGSDAPFAR